MARAAKLKAVAWAPADCVALGELVKARLAARAAGRPDLEAQALNEIGALELRRNRFAQSAQAFEQALALARRRGDRAGQAVALNGLGDLHLEKDFLTDSAGEATIAAYQEALALGRALSDPVIQGKSAFNLGNVYQFRRDLKLSLAYYRQAFDLQTRAADRAGRRQTARGLADLFFEEGESDRARHTLKTALAESWHAGDLTSAYELLMSLGSLQLQTGELETAVATLEQAVRICERVGAPLREAQARIQLATANRYLGEQERASSLYQQSIDLYQRQTRREGLGLPRLLTFPLVFLGVQLQPKIGFDEAERRYYQPALALVQTLSATPENEVLRATVYHFYGRALNDAGKPRQALHFFALTEPMLGDRKSQRARTQLELGKAYRALGELDRAGRELRGALNAGRELRELPLEAVTLHEIARLERDRGRPLEALQASTKAVSIIDTIRGKVASQTLRTSFFASQQRIYRYHLDLLMELHLLNSHGGYDRAALDVSERARARVLLDLLTEGRIDITHAVPAALKVREQAIERRVSRLQNEQLRGRRDAALDRELDRAEEDLRDLDEEIRRQSPRYAEILHPTLRTVSEIQNLLDEHTALLEFALTETSAFLFVVTREGFESFRLPITPLQVENRVRDLRRDLLDRDNPYNFILHAGTYHDLYRRLLGEAERGLLRRKRHWLIAPDGSLHLLNFEVLLTRPPSGEVNFDQPYLLRERTVHYIPSASVLAELAARRSSPEARETSSLEFFALADPRLTPREAGAASERDAMATFPPLLEARREVDGIAHLFPQGRSAVFQGDEATEGLVKTPVGGFRHSRRIHLATHGTFDEQRPESSALLLTAHPAGEDGRLTVAEIFNLRVDADLVVLSACNTGQGKQVAGEGLVGMSRAFFYAGAPTLVVSLWPADDVTTARLMTSFYRHMLRARDKAEALRMAKLEMSKNTSPYYWAPFILLGQATVEGAP